MNGLSDVRLALHSQELVNEHLVKTKSAMAVAVKTRSTPNLGWWATLCHRWTSRRAMPEHAQRQQRRSQMFAAWEGDVRDFGEQLETVAVLAANGFGQQPACQVGRIEPVTGVSLGIEHVGLILQAANLRQTVGPDADHAAPLIINLHVCQLRKYLQHLGAHVGCNVLRIAAGIMAGATEQQTPVC